MKMVVAQMYNCIRMEFRKCFHSHNFIISMATCVLLALSSASYCCQGYLNIHDALDQYCFENGHILKEILANQSNKITVLITHRYDDLTNQENIIVMEDGAVSAFGSFRELSTTSNIFAHLLRHIE